MVTILFCNIVYTQIRRQVDNQTSAEGLLTSDFIWIDKLYEVIPLAGRMRRIYFFSTWIKLISSCQNSFSADSFSADLLLILQTSQQTH